MPSSRHVAQTTTAALISVSLGLSQTPGYTAKPLIASRHVPLNSAVPSFHW